MTARPLRSLALGAVITLSVLARAADARAADAEAQALFDEGKLLLARGDIASACERFERSQHIEPAGGTLLHLARCREDQGRTATAWTLFNEALSAARTQGRKDREQVATEHLALLEPRLVRLRIVANGKAPIAQLKVTRDGKPVDAAGWGVAVPVDPGPHELAASAPGRRAWRSSVELRKEGTILDVVLPDLEREGDAAKPESVETPPFGTQRALALVAGGIGVVGLGLGTYFGLRSSSKHSEADNLCGGPAPKDCPLDGVEAGNTAQSLGTLSTVSFVVGAVALAGGVVLWLTAPTQRSADATTSLLRGNVRLTF